MIEREGGIEKLESLQQHENEEVYNSAVTIIDKYFLEEVSQFSREFVICSARLS